MLRAAASRAAAAVRQVGLAPDAGGEGGVRRASATGGKGAVTPQRCFVRRCTARRPASCFRKGTASTPSRFRAPARLVPRCRRKRMHSAVNGHPRCCSRLVARPRCRRLPGRWPPTASRASTPLPPARPARPHRARPLKRSSAGAAACASLAGKSQSRGGPDCLRWKRVLCAPESPGCAACTTPAR